MTGTPSEFEVRVLSMTWEAEGVVSLVLVRPHGDLLPRWEPGAHIDMLLPDGLGERQYSLCGDPGNNALWQVAVLRESIGRGGSHWVHSDLRPGDIVSVRGPRNNFPLRTADSYLFIAGGIGITPLLPMVEQLAREGADWRLLYGGRAYTSMAFTRRLAYHGSRVTLWPQDQHGLLELERHLATPRSGEAVYCCGPEVLLDAVETYCAGWPPGTLHVERFLPRPGALEGENQAFEVVLEQTGMVLVVDADTTIVQALETAGLDVPTSCRHGTCGTCETDVVEGEVDHRDSFLSAEEREDNATMMICCSRARSDRIVLDL